ncbi:hypothetical protein JCM10207_001830 [Rhodosporidiobolus poonsookiae]
MPLSDLPAELLHRIISLVYVLDGASACCLSDHPSSSLSPYSRARLASLALVHRSWTPFVEDELVRQLHVQSKGLHPELKQVLTRRREQRRGGPKSLVLETLGKNGVDYAADQELELMWRDVRAVRVLHGDYGTKAVLDRCTSITVLVVHVAHASFRLDTPFPRLRKLVLVERSRLELLHAIDPAHFPVLEELAVDISFVSYDAYLPPQQTINVRPVAPRAAGANNANNAAGPGQRRRRVVTSVTGPAGTVRPITLSVPTPSARSLAPMPVLAQITTLSLRAYEAPSFIPFLRAVVAASPSTPAGHSLAPLLHLRLETSGPERWNALAPVLEVMDLLDAPLKSFALPYALLEPLLFRLSRTPRPSATGEGGATPPKPPAKVPRSFSRLDRLVLTSFLGMPTRPLPPAVLPPPSPPTPPRPLSPSGTPSAPVPPPPRYVPGCACETLARPIEDDSAWPDLSVVRAYLAPLRTPGANGGRGMDVELRKVPMGLVGNEEC